MLSNDSITRLSADSGMRALQKWQPELTWFQQNMGRWKHVSFVRSQIARRRYFICMEAVFSRQSRYPHRIMRLLASYSQCTVIGIDYPLYLKRVFRKR
ncbi:hypothetical protein ACVXG9_24660 [Escherichia coli]